VVEGHLDSNSNGNMTVKLGYIKTRQNRLSR